MATTAEGILYGLIGYPLSHSFSKRYFAEKFAREGLHRCRYELFPLADIGELPRLLQEQPALAGLNVTLPHKQTVIALLDELDEEAAAVGAVNVIRIREGRMKGYNSDIYGFEQSLRSFLGEERPAALVLGSGGASRAVVHVLKKLDLPFRIVSRTGEGPALLRYEQVDAAVMAAHPLVVNTTPLGMAPATDNCPPLPYDSFGPEHFAYDLVYNPAQTLFLQKAEERGARTCNGLEMLYLQAERAWEIFNFPGE
jgi:shikimate dehydrogenase